MGTCFGSNLTVPALARKRSMYAVSVGDAYCAEIDTVEDLEAVGRAIAARTQG